MKLRPRIILLLVLCPLAAGLAQKANQYKDMVLSDAHLHLLDFLQNGDYLENGQIVKKEASMTLPIGKMGKRVEAALWAMDDANVSHALICRS